MPNAISMRICGKEVVEFLLERGIDLGVRTSYSRTGLHNAALS
jgi:hypothetical protein